MKEGGRTIQRLHRLYGKEPFKRDRFGRRKALSREIEAVVEDSFKKQLEQHLPGEKDLEIKND